ncbi:lysozyme inhibitor LprI family protein [Celeribacter marinus]|uniref:lysozyme inhibitor LprI family protein n=1 Tax=Celeribacter marinus TaxID=1397108 RepID=UPI00317012E7
MLQYFRLVGLALLLSVGVGSVAKAASFDCNKATTETEIAICSDPELSALDDRLSAIYVRGRQVTKNVSGSDLKIQTDQINWLNKRNQCGLETDCLVNAYQTRIKELSEFDFENLFKISEIEKQICKDQLARDSDAGNTLEMVDAGNEYNRCLERIIVSLVTATTLTDSQSIRNDLDDLSNSYKSIIGDVFIVRKECFPYCGSIYQLYPSAMYSDILEELLTIVGEAPYE